jgi:Archaeal/vacuolar-type H+-ATPase subunit I
MFGDLGHGLIMAAFGGWMVLREKPLAAKKSDSEVRGTSYCGWRAVLFLSALGSIQPSVCRLSFCVLFYEIKTDLFYLIE